MFHSLAQGRGMPNQEQALRLHLPQDALAVVQSTLLKSFMGQALAAVALAVWDWTPLVHAAPITNARKTATC